MLRLTHDLEIAHALHAPLVCSLLAVAFDPPLHTAGKLLESARRCARSPWPKSGTAPGLNNIGRPLLGAKRRVSHQPDRPPCPAAARSLEHSRYRRHDLARLGNISPATDRPRVPRWPTTGGTVRLDFGDVSVAAGTLRLPVGGEINLRRSRTDPGERTETTLTITYTSFEEVRLR